MSAEANKTIARRLIEETFNKGNLAVVDEFCAMNYVGYDPALPNPSRGPVELKQNINMYRTAFPDAHLTVEEQVAEGDTVVSRWTARGTHKGPLMGIPPTGKQATATGITISHFAGGKVVEERVNWDALGLLRQLGVVPPLEQAVG
jgi:steroid delta-isomerase-like uncharacterized protein